MNIYEYADFMKQKSQGHSYSFLAERVQTSDEAPYRIAVTKDAVKPDDAVVLALGGSGDGANIEGHNWFIKYITNFIRNNEKLNSARVCVAVCDMSEKYKGYIARTAYNVKKLHPKIWRFLKNVNQHYITKLDLENYKPWAVKDIFNDVILPKVTDNTGNKLPINQMLKNVRGITIIAYCAGGHTAMYLEEEIKSRMLKIGYNSVEIRAALNQIPVIGYAMNCPYAKSDLHFISFNSIADNHNEIFTPVLHRYLFIMESDFGVMHVKNKNCDDFVCTKIGRAGIEGNPNILYGMKIEEYLDRQAKEDEESHQESKDDMFNDHTFLGFVEKNGYSIGAKNLQTLFKNVIVGATENSIQNSKGNNFIPLPQMEDLVGDAIDVYGRANLAYMRESFSYALYYLACQTVCKTLDMIKLYRWGKNHKSK